MSQLVNPPPIAFQGFQQIRRDLLTNNPEENSETVNYNEKPNNYRLIMSGDNYGNITRKNLLTNNPDQSFCTKRYVPRVVYEKISFKKNRKDYLYNAVPF